MKKILFILNIVVALAVVGVGGFFLETKFYGPLKEELDQLAAEEENKEKTLDELLAKNENYGATLEKLEKAREDYYTYGSFFREDWDEVEMLTYLNDTIGDNFEKKGFLYKGLEDRGAYSVASFDVKIKGPVGDFSDLLVKLENDGYYTEITDVNVSEYSYDNNVSDESFTIVFYVLTEKGQ